MLTKRDLLRSAACAAAATTIAALRSAMLDHRMTRADRRLTGNSIGA